MDIQTRKIEFIQDFLKLKSEAAIARFEALMKKQKGAQEDPFGQEELVGRIQQSEADFARGRHKSSEELLKKYE